MFKLAQKKKEEEEKKELAEKPGFAKQISIRSKLLNFRLLLVCVSVFLVSVNIQRWLSSNQNYPVSVFQMILRCLVVPVETCSIEFGDVDNLRKFTLTIKPCEMQCNLTCYTII